MLVAILPKSEEVESIEELDVATECCDYQAYILDVAYFRDLSGLVLSFLRSNRLDRRSWSACRMSGTNRLALLVFISLND